MQRALRGPFNGAILGQLERLFHHGTAVGLDEGELLDRFLRAGDELAFEALLARFGPMVLGVCRQFLRDPNDIDDAFQATFLVLVSKAGSLRRRELVGNWLYGVAHRVAWRSRAVSARRSARAPHGHDAVDRLAAREDRSSAAEAEPASWLHEEVRRLPEKYRALVLLCYFEGQTHEQAAARLGCPIGTVKGRLARAREILRRRLVRRGVTLTSAAIGSQLAEAPLNAAVPDPLVFATVRAARAAVACSARSLVAATGVSLPVAALTDGVLQTMVITQLKAVALPLLLAGVVTTGAVLVAAGPQSGRPGEPQAKTPARPRVAASSEKATPDPEEGRRKLAVVDLLEVTQQLYDQLAGDDRLFNERDLPKLKGLSERILMASCELGPLHGSRVAEYTAHRDRMKGLARKMKSFADGFPSPHRKQVSDLAASYLAEAEKLLEREKAKAKDGQPDSGKEARTESPGAGASGAGGMAGMTASAGQPAAAKGEPPAGQGNMAAMIQNQVSRMSAMSSLMGGVYGGATSDGPSADLRDRVEIAQLASVLATLGANTKDQAALKRLDELEGFSVPSPTTLKAILDQIRSSLKGSQGHIIVPVFVDPRGLEQARVTLDSPINLDVQGLPFKTALRLTLRQLGLAYCVRDGVLFISSYEGIREELAEAAGELRGLNQNNLDEIIQSTRMGNGMMMGGGMR
ncbi:MAG: RNA polymerase sigma factor [Isosphaeraceae bacterium]